MSSTSVSLNAAPAAEAETVMELLSDPSVAAAVMLAATMSLVAEPKPGTIDTSKSELIAANNSVEGIKKFVEADSLGYLSLPALRKAVCDDEKLDYCYACYTGDYPTELTNIEELSKPKLRRA